MAGVMVCCNVVIILEERFYKRDGKVWKCVYGSKMNEISK